MVIRGRKLNGKATLALLLVPVLSWAGFVTYSTITQAAWTAGHEDWTETTLAGVMRDFTRIEERLGKMDEKLDKILKRLPVKP